MSIKKLLQSAKKERHVRTNTTVRESTLDRLDVLVAQVIKHDPSTNRSKLLDAILSEKLDELNIQLPKGDAEE
jgi:hypothetical protein